MLICKRVLIHGRVQGVFFRQNTQKKALELNLKGWVRNNPDGTVEALFLGEQAQVQQMLIWCHHGPTSARVELVQEFTEPLTQNYSDFVIDYD